MSRPARLVVLASGSGSNLQAIIDACEAARIPGDVVAVVCNRADAFALQRAMRHGIPAECLLLADVRRAGGTREDFDGRLAEAVSAHAPDLIVLAGFMHVLSPRFLGRFPDDAVVNLHPSLLPPDPRDDVVVLEGRAHPVFRGHDAPRQALAAGVASTGTSVHFVTAEVDRGPVIAMEAVAVRPDDTLETLQHRIQGHEHALLPRALGELLRARGFVKVASPVPAEGP